LLSSSPWPFATALTIDRTMVPARNSKEFDTIQPADLI
jgi:hypothetical protein